MRLALVVLGRELVALQLGDADDPKDKGDTTTSPVGFAAPSGSWGKPIGALEP